MHPLVLLSAALQIACAVHVVRTGRPLYWIFILLIGSYIAVAVYVVAEVLPGMRHDPRARKVARGVRDRIDPGRDRRAANHRLEVADTLDNRRALAEESLRSGDFATAADLYRQSLKGLYETDPTLMLGLAKAQFGLGEPLAARATLDALIAANPGFRSTDGHLLYARAVEASGDVAATREEYEALVQDHPGEEARVRYAQFLQCNGDAARARQLFEETLKRARLAPAYYAREQREWIEIAKRETR